MCKIKGLTQLLT